MDKEIFALVGTEAEKIKIWQDLASSKIALLCKGSDETLCKTRAQFFDKHTNELECVFDDETHVKDGEEFLAHFTLNADKYYFQGTAKLKTDTMILSIPTELYRLQRRQTYRVHIPDSYKAFFNIIKINDQAAKISCHLEDLSSHGCRAQIKKNEPLNVNDKVAGYLVIANNSPIEVQGVVKHKNAPAGANAPDKYGIEFSQVDSILENKLFAITLEIHKQLFKRLF